MGEDIMIKLLGNVGVPAAICFYTLFRVNETLKDLTHAINKLCTDNDHRLEKVESAVRELRYRLDIPNHDIRSDRHGGC